MFKLKQTEQFSSWLKGLDDPVTRQRLVKRLRKLSLGHLGDVQPVGNGVFELREHFGPGWRMYFLHRDSILVVMLGGGDKSTQTRDIAKAITLAKSLRD